MRVCLLPLKAEVRNPRATLNNLKTRFEQAARFRPDLVCLPECALTGYLFEKTDLQKFAETIPGYTSSEMSRLAKSHRTHLCFGMLELSNERVYDSAVFMDRNAEILAVHRKISETEPFATGTDITYVKTEHGRLGILLCGDLFHDDIPERLDRSIDFLLVPMSRGFDKKSPDLERWLNEERREYIEKIKSIGITTFLVNSLEYAEIEGAFGGALIVSKDGELLAESPHGTDDILLWEFATSQ